MWMNAYDIEAAQQRYNNATGYPMVGALADNLAALVDWTNANSDGWPYWSKPSAAARRAMAALTNFDARARHSWNDREPDLTATDVKRALTPVRAFLTRHGVRPDDVLLPIPTA